MAARGAGSGRSYLDFNPTSKWIREEDSDTLIIHLPGFKKEAIKVQRDALGNLKITGERYIGDNTWNRFVQDVQVPANYDFNRFLASFENGELQILMPKIITPIIAAPETIPQLPPSQKPVSEEEFQPRPSQKPVSTKPPPSQKPISEKPPSQKPISEKPPSQKPVTQPPPSQKPDSEPNFQPPPSQKPTTHPDKKMDGKASEPKVTEKTPEQEQVDGDAGAKNVTGEEEEEEYEMAEERTDDGTARVNNGSAGGVVAADMGLHGPKQLILNVIVGILVVLALLVYVKYTQGFSRKVTDH
ncbi:hypothetical protein NE237_009924 [Protea cynaroides]|uniref:SHSP domain-containing protein n=1 Tax=Protea cynaroides TaxID=273540 RepID=A0A9Q0KYT8_9MAGN|nr:hypothetical protein NE237_009924 [Protea cynaroides]